MQKNWYIIYTKTKCEKKVATILAKKGIENYFPLNCKEIKSFRKTKIHREPLFSAYVFAYISENEMGKAMEIDGVVNFVYWRGAPAIVQEDEIDAIRNFTTNHHDIRLEKAQINQEKPIKVAVGPRYSMDGNILTIKNQSAKVNLPSIGFTMIAHVDSESMLGREVSFGNKQLSLQ